MSRVVANGEFDQAVDPPEAGDSVEDNPVAFQEHFDSAPVLAGWREIVGGFVALTAWFVLLAGGILVGTQGFVQSITDGVGFLDTIRFSALVFLFWTITNVGLLSCVAAVLGAFGQRTRFASRLLVFRENSSIRRTNDGERREVVIHYASAVMRGFGVYALVLSGLLVLATDALIQPSQSQYVRLAAMVSVISFYAGYDPEMFASFLGRIKKFLENK